MTIPGPGAGDPARPPAIRRFLDGLYRGAGILAAACIAGLCLLISAQILLNAGTRLGLPLPPTIPSYADFAGYGLACATFLALPWTLRTGGHVRVGLVTQRLPARAAFVAELIALTLAATMVAYALTYTVLLAEESHRFGDTSPGIVPIPLWLPQSVMVLGLALLLVALIDSLVGTWRARAPVLARTAEE
ncbi:MAG: TRAP transporter small permease [Pseudomonadota bacterium]